MAFFWIHNTKLKSTIITQAAKEYDVEQLERS